MRTAERNIAGLLQNAIVAQQQGAVREARRLYEQALRVAPRNADALHLLGLACIDDGQTEKGLQLIRRAIAYRPDYLEAINNIAIELAKLDRHAEARGFLEKALKLNPNQPDVHYNLGRSLHELSDYPAALESYDRAVALQPGHFEAWNNRGITLHALGAHENAVASYDRALALKPDYHEAWTNRAISLYALGRFEDALAGLDNAIVTMPDYAPAWLNRGHSLYEIEKETEALAAYDKVIALKPDDADGHISRAVVLSKLNRFTLALESLDRARALRPEGAFALITRANILQGLRRPADSLAAADELLALQPDNVEALCSRGSALQGLRRDDEALESYDKAVALNPEHAEGRLNRAYLLLYMGRLADAWPEHEYRWRLRRFKIRRTHLAPQWKGEALAGKHLLIFTEQGFGDIVQFSRYIPILRRMGAQMTFVGPDNIHRLLRPVLDGVRTIIDLAQAGTPDYETSLMSIPCYLGTTLATIPNEVPYLFAEPELRARWRERLGPPGRRIGIAWQGNPVGAVDIGRSIPLRRFAPLSDLPGTELISLQFGYGTEQLNDLPAGMRVRTLGEEFNAGPDSFVDTAAVMAELDLIITSDTAVAHVAGALARPVWVALQYVPDWRWMTERTDNPWYPNTRLFRQPAPGDWESVFAAMRAELERQ